MGCLHVKRHLEHVILNIWSRDADAQKALNLCRNRECSDNAFKRASESCKRFIEHAYLRVREVDIEETHARSAGSARRSGRSDGGVHLVIQPEPLVIAAGEHGRPEYRHDEGPRV